MPFLAINVGMNSLGVAFKGPEGIVLAADSRVTLTQTINKKGQPPMTLPSTFDNAIKLLRIKGQDYVGVVTYGLGALGQQEPRTAHSFIPEFEKKLQDEEVNDRLPVEDFCKKLGEFFMDQWSASMPNKYKGPDLIFFVGGYDPGAAYGRVFEINIPQDPQGKEWHKNEFGPIWGGQLEHTSRLIHGFDPRLPGLVAKEFKGVDVEKLQAALHKNLQLGIPYQFLPLQDCVDLSIFLIRNTIMLQSFVVGMRGVGGAIDVATITKTEGFNPIQQKGILGERGVSTERD